VVERTLGKGEVESSILSGGTIPPGIPERLPGVHTGGLTVVLSANQAKNIER
jgi:hypothetical protein